MNTTNAEIKFDPTQGPPPLPDKQARRRLLVSECRAEWIGDFFVIFGPGDCALWREHRALCRMKVAWEILIEQNPHAGWKNFDLLMTLRQAVRECDAQRMGLELPEKGAGQAVLKEFLRQARALDAVHHGEATF